MLTTCGTVVRRVGHQEVNRATGAYIAKVVQGALVGCVARGEMPTSGAGGLLIVTAIKSQLGCWEVLDVDNALGGVWHVFTRSKHGWLPWKKGWDQSIKVITCPVYIESRIPATVSVNVRVFPCSHILVLTHNMARPPKTCWPQIFLSAPRKICEKIGCATLSGRTLC